MESNTNKDEKKMSKEDLEKKMHKLEVSKKELSQKLIEKKISALDYEIEQVKQGSHPLIREKLKEIEIKRQHQEKIIENLVREKKKSIEKEYQSRINQINQDYQSIICEAEFSEHFPRKFHHQHRQSLTDDGPYLSDDLYADLKAIKALSEKP